ncbi:MAG TPA: hypothetical protein VJ161_06250 [Geobacteraceae bacterium]|nr:hypothetical protein [Geobacteraceae bacterium]
MTKASLSPEFLYTGITNLALRLKAAVLGGWQVQRIRRKTEQLSSGTAGEVLFLKTADPVLRNSADRAAKADGQVGVVPDESNLHPWLAGFDNSCFCGALHGMRKGARGARARELLRIRQFIADLHQAGKTFFLTTHYIEEAERLCGLFFPVARLPAFLRPCVPCRTRFR